MRNSNWVSSFYILFDIIYNYVDFAFLNLTSSSIATNHPLENSSSVNRFAEILARFLIANFSDVLKESAVSKAVANSDSVVA